MPVEDLLEHVPARQQIVDPPGSVAQLGDESVGLRPNNGGQRSQITLRQAIQIRHHFDSRPYALPVVRGSFRLSSSIGTDRAPPESLSPAAGPTNTSVSYVYRKNSLMGET